MKITTLQEKELHRDLNLLQVQEIFKLYCLKFVYKQQQFLLPDIYDTYFTNNSNVHQHNTRQKHGLYVTQPMNKYGKHFIKYIGAILWNGLPEDTQTSLTIKRFSRKVKDTLIKQY